MTVTVASAIYDAASATLQVTFAGAGGTDSIDPTHITVTGQGGATYTLTASPQAVFGTGVFLAAAADQASLNRLFNKNGTTSADGTTYNIALTSGFDQDLPAVSPDSLANVVTVQNYAAPTITSATYNAATSVLTVTGNHLINTVGATNDITVGKLTFTGQGGTPYTLSTSGNVEVTSATSFTVTLSGADIAAVNALLNKNGAASSGNVTYNLAAADGWDGVVAGGDAVATAAIAVQGNTPTTTVTGLSINGDTGASTTDFITATAAQSLTITLSAAVLSGEIVQWSVDNGLNWFSASNNPNPTTWKNPITLSGSNTLQARVISGNNASTAFTQAYMLDTAAPTYTSATVNGNSLVMTYGEALDAVHPPGNGAFSVLAGGAADVVTGVAVNSVAKTVTLTLTTAVTPGQVVTVGYTDPTGGNDPNAVQDLAGNDAATVAAQAVTNTTAAPSDSGPATVPGITASAPIGGGTVQGGAGNDTLSGISGSNTFFPVSGSDTVTGGSGRDTVVIAGSSAGYTLAHNTDGSFTLQSVSDAGTVVKMTGVERLVFNNQTLALDVTPVALQVDGLYKLALGRDPEDAGLAYYVAAAAQGVTVAQMATGFVASAEFAKAYGSLGDAAFVTQLYANAFNRAPDSGGMAFYLDLLAHLPGAAGRAALLADFVSSQEETVKLAGLADHGIPLLG
ncbi:MAG: SwmB domain-containing protein [Pseudomonadota bacterium]